ncbi:RNA 2',3'-cyclic phosphodiesterase [Ancylobacter sp. Lp-2]|uniref:RNA 2',3'-cyclic phosphodiesterase n=1 Tax=Ancylobacter sp. Lp-2 TaxID=2881339 RepID=UPI001E3070ED|nr:RNA 2',3'-cyclic phosphodiesterase [Ancylobacter sp. Lp-2]MCB4770810.1 RNA 2',3'-cyclic phosphodiesterase [Ancylobacter sp. Lp-2]
MPRLFTALEIPAHVAGTLSMLRGGLPGARWIDPEFYHVTLRFIGDVDHAMARDAAAALDEVDRFGFDLTLDGVDQFGNNKPRAIFAAVKANNSLIELQAEHERLMKRIGLPPEGRNFRPHVTLARLRDAAPRQVADYLSLRGYFRSPSFEVSRFVLYSSRDSVGGGPYRVEAAYPLM